MLNKYGSIASIIALLLAIPAIFGWSNYTELFSCSTHDACVSEGKKHRSNKEYEDAIKSFGIAIKHRQNSSLAYSLRGLCYFDIKEYDDALRDFDKTIKINPNFGEHYYNRGLVYLQMGTCKQVVNDFKIAFDKSDNKEIKDKAKKIIENISSYKCK